MNSLERCGFRLNKTKKKINKKVKSKPINQIKKKILSNPSNFILKIYNGSREFNLNQKKKDRKSEKKKKDSFNCSDKASTKNRSY